jgi:hypothetical protein
MVKDTVVKFMKEDSEKNVVKFLLSEMAKVVAPKHQYRTPLKSSIKIKKIRILSKMPLICKTLAHFSPIKPNLLFFRKI